MAELEGERRLEIEAVASQCKLSDSKLRPPLLRDCPVVSGIAGRSWVAQFTSGFPMIGTVSEGGVYRLTQKIASPVSESELLDGAPGRRKARIFPRKSPRDSELWGESRLCVGKGWLDGPHALSRDAVLRDKWAATPSSPLF